MEQFDELYQLPKSVSFPKLSRYFALIMGILLIIYSIFVIFTKLNENTSTFMKIVPFFIAFLALDSITRNLFSLNKITINEQELKLTFLAKKSVTIPWLRMTKMEIYKGKAKGFNIFYIENGQEKKYFLTMQFPKMIEIINLIVFLAPHVEYDEFVKSLAILPKSKNN
ncbi:MAG: hypothetical protein RBS16_04155 [Candidatus Cloacimonadales bacterium]|jgi:hypothetical protein|nr:hypothetical protein [Candidatus Cloacimonadota bacterium]MDD2650016.1 hypothetical protein [Candidatus Cloacimonadota bacterium]MDD3501033.1 hypothetical protein [Candidatus Cloacimonadota bacterium]MDX9977207.1 hypothetical protein [Candidatus Cloacimonadales bacterium]